MIYIDILFGLLIGLLLILACLLVILVILACGVAGVRLVYWTRSGPRPGPTLRPKPYGTITLPTAWRTPVNLNGRHDKPIFSPKNTIFGPKNKEKQ